MNKKHLRNTQVFFLRIGKDTILPWLGINIKKRRYWIFISSNASLCRINQVIESYR